MSKNDLTSSDLWDNRWKTKKENKLKNRNSNQKILGIKDAISNCPINGNLLELGGAPGTMAEIHFYLRPDLCIDCVDFSPEGVEQAKQKYNELGIRGKVIHSDFREYAKLSGEKYDFVCSYGLIEHFTNFEQVMKYHLDFVKPGGIVYIMVPNYSVFPVHNLLELFSKETIETHNFKCMNKELLKNTMIRLGGKNTRSGEVGISILPHSTINPGILGKLYRLFCKLWNFTNSLIYKYTNGLLAIKLWGKTIYVISYK
jgi:2-polyprenyl-3-methyl-5-hydroxy-6-metoxy-1,4-benzoquinol methylase